MMLGLFPLYPSGTMNTATPDWASLWRIEDKKFKKNSLEAVPRRGPEAVVHRRDYDFHGSGVNSRSCPFLQSQNSVLVIQTGAHLPCSPQAAEPENTSTADVYAQENVL
jgi:hypothetical protein